MKGKGTQKLLIFALCLAISMIPFTQAAARRENRKQPYSHVSAQKEEVSLITRQPEAGGIMILGDEPEAPPSFSVEVDVPDGAEISCVCDVDGQPCENWTEFVLTQYQEMPCGVHQIQCHIFCRTPEGIERTEDSIPVSWILCRGIMMDTVLTFSDVHGDYPYIGQAISEIMAENEGRIPALILCSGDWANERRAVSREVTESVCIPAILAQAGGIDTLLVAGNHENGAAAEALNLAMDLGADESGVVFLSGTDGCGTSAGIQDLAVYGISFDDIVIHEDEKEACSYAGILENLKAFLETQKDTGRKIVILSHTGLHTLGIQRESSAKEWSGSEKYNPDLSAEVVCLLNKYAESYGMEIVFLFGHNHSKQEGEFYLGPGDRIDSTQNYAQRSVSSQDLKFAYAHAGYLTGRSNGTKHYSVLSLTQDGLSISLRKLSE